MNKFKQCTYTIMLMLTCFIASPFIFHQIWKSSAEAKKKVEIPPPPVVSTDNSSGTPQTPGGTPEGGNVTPGDQTPGDPQEGADPGQPAQDPVNNAPAIKFITSDPSYFNDALFIGDSRTVGIKEYGTLKNATYFCEQGLAASTINNAKIDGKTFEEAIEEKQYGKVYLMLGINECGNDFETTVTAYRAIVERIKVHQPNAVIYLQANLHVSLAASTSVVNNENINYLNSRIASLADNERVYYIDVNELYDDENGALTPAYSYEGIHPKGEYYKQWCEWLCARTVAGPGEVVYYTEAPTEAN